MDLTPRQEQILSIVKADGPITGENIADRLSLTRATLRPDLAILTMAGFLDARPRVGYFFTGKTGTELVSDKIKKLKVREYYSVPVVVNDQVSVYDAICSMFLEDVGTLFVVDKQSLLIGVLSRKDLLRASMGQQELHEIPVHIIMTRLPKIKYCEKDDLLIDASLKLIENQIDALPVIAKRESGLEVVGRLTKTNVTKAFVELVKSEEV
ncbi:transcriptional repressor CcpN [Halalkalibacillus sediminis]|uniref:Transcriptional repressor CcpN n=1 Tax=Halalkalibacillus sediminis TaxID=2018042 RepID=A0A2I0QY41_9BACI|nr:helix-turn-helix transcriptional regulator [Halalkalibacillus sediminis]PKR79020.1 transcriptional repressor CcpN [Halalkalibacillus sediminis]